MGDELLTETLSQLFSKHCGPAERQRAETDGWLDGCWDKLTESGLAWVGIAEVVGGRAATCWMPPCWFGKPVCTRYRSRWPRAQCWEGGWQNAAVSRSATGR